jgi:hypothetical protein
MIYFQQGQKIINRMDIMKKKVWKSLYLITGTLLLLGCGGPEQGETAAGEETPADQTTLGQEARRAPIAESGAAGLKMPSSGDVARAVEALNMAGLAFRIPSGWVEETPSSAMRAAQYRLPGQEGDAEMAVFHFAPGQGGSIQANIDRWLGQFEPEDGSEQAAGPSTETMQKNGYDITVVQTEGTYQPAAMGPMMPQGPPRFDSALYGVIIDAKDQGTIFLKTVGPKKTLEEHREELEDFVQNLQSGAPSQN